MRKRAVRLTVSALAAALSYFLLSPSAFDKSSGGLLTLFSILAGLVAQSMVFTAMLVSPDKLPSQKLRALEETLEKQQAFWVKQFRIYLIASLSIATFSSLYEQWFKQPECLEVARYAVAVNVFMISWAVISALSFPRRVLGLQRLRFIVLNDERTAKGL